MQQIDLVDVLRDNWRIVPHLLKARVMNLQNLRHAFGNGQHHYDIGNDLYEAMLDHRMIYTCALWSTGARTLDEAQDAKLELVCTKLGLRPGMRVLDLGCGWAGFAAYAAERYGCRGRRAHRVERASSIGEGALRAPPDRRPPRRLP